MTGRALFLAADLPWPEDGGGRIVSLRMLEAVARQLPVDLVAVADTATRLDLTRLKEICDDVEVISLPFSYGRHPLRQAAIATASALTRSPYRLVKFRSGDFARAVRNHLADRHYSLLHLDQFGVAPYMVKGCPTTYLAHNVESDMYALGARHANGAARRLWARREAAKLRRAERHLLPSIGHVFTLSQRDGDLVRQAGMPRVSTIPVPVVSAAQDPAKPPAWPIVLTMGTMSWFGVEDGLRWFHDEVWPLIRARVPGARWRLVGANPSSRIKSWNREEQIEVLGYVEDIGRVIAGARVCVIPLHVAGGVRIKLIDLLNRGLPCVSTSVGALGLSFEDGHGAFRRDDPRSFADAVTALLKDDELWESTAAAGHDYVALTHTPEALDAVVAAGIADATKHAADLRTEA